MKNLVGKGLDVLARLRYNSVVYCDTILKSALVVVNAAYHFLLDANRHVLEYTYRRVNSKPFSNPEKRPPASSGGPETGFQRINAVAASIGIHVKLLYRSKMNPAFHKSVHMLSSGVERALRAFRAVTNAGVGLSLKTIRIVDYSIDEICSYAGFSHSEEKKATEMIEVINTLVKLFSPLSIMSPLDLIRSVSIWSVVQTITCSPYPPRSQYLLDPSRQENSKDLYNLLAYRLLQSLATYNKSVLSICSGFKMERVKATDSLEMILGLAKEDIILRKEYSEFNKPAHFVVVDHSARCICVLIRGSNEMADVLTDLCNFTDRMTPSHLGMQKSADFVDRNTRKTIKSLIAKHPNYEIACTGHSLGAGTATLLTQKWKEDESITQNGAVRLYGYAFAAPCVVDVSTSKSLIPHVTSVIYARDIISRASNGSWNNLLNLLSFFQANKKQQTVLKHSTFLNRLANMSTWAARGSTERPARGSGGEPASLSGGEPFPDGTGQDVLEEFRQTINLYNEALSCEMKASYRLKLTEMKNRLSFLFDKEGVLVPGGRCILVMPTSHFPKTMTQGNVDLSRFLISEDHIMLELEAEEIVKMAAEIVLNKEAILDHSPQRLADAFSLKFSFPT